MDVLTAILIACMMQAVSLQKIPSVKEYFPSVSDDLTQVTWAHAVNSIEKFQKALEDKVMMLEADVIMGTLMKGNDSSIVNIPIMGHPPDDTSDLSLEDFLTRVITVKGVGIKLDFKTTEVLNQSLTILSSYKSNFTFPVWLNADILLGPVDSNGTVVDPDVFLPKCAEMFPEATLSPGWKVRFGGDITNGSYLPEHISAMKDLLVRNNINQPVTFPVQVGLASMSLDTLPEILDVSNITDNTLTLWGNAADFVDIKGLQELIKAVGKNKVYTDLPQSLLDQLRNSSRSNYSAMSFILLLLISLTTAAVWMKTV